MIWKANKENVDYKIIITQNKNGLLYIHKQRNNIYYWALKPTKLKMVFKTNNSLEHNLQTRKQSKHKRDKYLASCIHKSLCPTCHKKYFDHTSILFSKDVNNIYAPLKTIVRKKIFPVPLR
jgi:hypothetical protein